jgi:tetratricopeptide (TPR) repeat protein
VPPLDRKVGELTFQDGVNRVAALDASNGWNPATCAEVADIFTQASGWKDAERAALYDAGVVHQRCHDLEGAKASYEAALAKDPAFHRARVGLALVTLALSKSKEIEPAIADLARAVKDSSYQNTDALVNLARLQMVRGDSKADGDGADDWDRAKKNLQRALAVDDGNLPAYGELAHYYYEMAKRHGKSGKLDRQELDLALVVAQQAVRRDATYAPIHNTAGLIAYALGDLALAATEFGSARRLDPSFFEAHVNYAALNLEFRGFEQAEIGYRKALELRPDDYDAHLGLSLALRGQIDDAHHDERVAQAEAEIEKAKQLDPARPEAYFNQAILTERFKLGDPAQLNRAIDLYKEFVARADSKPEFASTVRDVVAVPTKSDPECMREGSADDPACKKGRISTLLEVIQFTTANR